LNADDRQTLMMETLMHPSVQTDAAVTEPESKLDRQVLKDNLFSWLGQLRLPQSDGPTSWENYVEDYSNPAKSSPEHIQSHKVFFAIHLYTSSSQYLILVKGASAEDATDVGIITVSARLREADQRIQKALRIAYGNSEQAPERLVNTVWIENFVQSDFISVLDRCATAILGNEIVAGRKGQLPPQKDDGITYAAETSDIASDQLLLDLIKQLPEPARDEMITLLSRPARPFQIPKID
jgi:hypothetical protein